MYHNIGNRIEFYSFIRLNPNDWIGNSTFFFVRVSRYRLKAARRRGVHSKMCVFIVRERGGDVE
jgi:hypothetical protein